MKCDKSAILGLIILIGFFIVLSVVFIQNKKLGNSIFKNKEGLGGEIKTNEDVKKHFEEDVKISNIKKAAVVKGRNAGLQLLDGKNTGGDNPFVSEKIEENDEGNVSFKKEEQIIPLEKKHPLIGDNDKCEEINNANYNDSSFCKALVGTKCGMCLNPDEGTAKAALGNETGGPATRVCDSKNWTKPMENIESVCRKQLDRLVCSEVKDCSPMTDKEKELCAWCPIEGKAFVYDKNQKSKWLKNNNDSKGEYIPKYPKLDKCDWPNVKLDNGQTIPTWLGWNKGKLDKSKGFSGPMIHTDDGNCEKLGKNFPCLIPGILKKGVHSDKCKQDMWLNSGCSGDYRTRYNISKNEFGDNKIKKEFEKIEESKKDGIKFDYSYVDMYNSMKKFPSKAESRDYNEARLYKRMCYNKTTDACDDKYKNADSNPIVNRPDDCLNKLWDDSGCTNGRYAPSKIQTYHNNKQLRNTNEYTDILYKKPSSDVKNLYKEINSKSTSFERDTTKESVNDPNHIDQSIFWQESCHGELTQKTKDLIKNKKPCWKDFTHIIGNAHNVEIKTDKIIFNNDSLGIKDPYMSDNNQIRSVMLGDKNGHDWGTGKEITQSMYEKPNFPYWKFMRQSSTVYNSPYTLQYSGSINNKLQLNQAECKNYASENGFRYKTGNWGGDPTNCFMCKAGVCSHSSEQDMVFFNTTNNTNNCGSNSYSCVKKTGIVPDKMTWDEFKLIMAGDGKKLKDFEDVIDNISVRQKKALERYKKNKKFGIGGVTSPAPNVIVMEKRTDFTRTMNLYGINPKWSASRPVNGKCPDCSLVPCGQCQAGCSKSSCAGGSRNNCPNNNDGRSPSRCDVPEGNVITKNMFLHGYGPEKKQFPYWEFIKIAKRMGQKPFQ